MGVGTAMGYGVRPWGMGGYTGIQPDTREYSQIHGKYSQIHEKTAKYTRNDEETAKYTRNDEKTANLSRKQPK